MLTRACSTVCSPAWAPSSLRHCSKSSRRPGFRTIEASLSRNTGWRLALRADHRIRAGARRAGGRQHRGPQPRAPLHTQPPRAHGRRRRGRRRRSRSVLIRRGRRSHCGELACRVGLWRRTRTGAEGRPWRRSWLCRRRRGVGRGAGRGTGGGGCAGQQWRRGPPLSWRACASGGARGACWAV